MRKNKSMNMNMNMKTNQPEGMEGYTERRGKCSAHKAVGEFVEVSLFRDGERYRDDVYVCVNGEGCLIRRGEPVRVPRPVAEALEHSARQDARAEAMMAGRTFH